MRCILCEKQRGKRHCPAKEGLICAACCGSKRIVEIDCPSNCQYLKEGLSYQLGMAYSRFARSLEPGQALRAQKLLSEHEVFFQQLQKRIVGERRFFPDLRDNDVLAAVELLVKDYETERRGIIYESASPVPEQAALSRALKEEIEKWRRPFDLSRDRVSLAVVLDCLKLLKEFIEYFIGQRFSPTSFLDFACQLYPEHYRRPGGPTILLA